MTPYIRENMQKMKLSQLNNLAKIKNRTVTITATVVHVRERQEERLVARVKHPVWNVGDRLFLDFISMELDGELIQIAEHES